MKKLLLLFIPLLFIACEKNAEVEQETEPTTEQKVETTVETQPEEVENNEEEYINEILLPSDFKRLSASVWNPHNINYNNITLTDELLLDLTQNSSLKVYETTRRFGNELAGYGSLIDTFELDSTLDAPVNGMASHREVTFDYNGRGVYTHSYYDFNNQKTINNTMFFYYILEQGNLMKCYKYPNNDFSKKPDIGTVGYEVSENYFAFGVWWFLDCVNYDY